MEYTSKASARQRKGRVGRTSHGYCYRMYSKQRYEAMEDYTKPKIQRIPLTTLCLRTKAISPSSSIEEFILGTIQPPSSQNVRTGIASLIQIGALDSNEQMTPFGGIAVTFPIDCRLVKALLHSIGLRCYEPVMRIAAMLSVKNPFRFESNAETRTKIMEKKCFCLQMPKTAIVDSFGMYMIRFTGSKRTTTSNTIIAEAIFFRTQQCMKQKSRLK